MTDDKTPDKKNTLKKTLKPGEVLFIGGVEISVDKRATIKFRVPADVDVCGPPRANCKQPPPVCNSDLKKKLGWDG